RFATNIRGAGATSSYRPLRGAPGGIALSRRCGRLPQRHDGSHMSTEQQIESELTGAESVLVPALQPNRASRRVLEPAERIAEVLFGLIMVLTFTGSLSVVAASGSP